MRRGYCVCGTTWYPNSTNPSKSTRWDPDLPSYRQETGTTEETDHRRRVGRDGGQRVWNCVSSEGVTQRATRRGWDRVEKEYRGQIKLSGIILDFNRSRTQMTDKRIDLVESIHEVFIIYFIM